MSQEAHTLPVSTLGDALNKDFFDALWRDDIAYVRARLNAGVSPNVRVDMRDRAPTALAEAISNRRFAIAYLLLDSGADVKPVDGVGRTALHRAAVLGSGELVQRLIDLGAQLEVHDHSGMTPLHCAAEYGPVENCIRLLDVGARIDAVANNHMTALHYAAGENRCASIRLLAERGCGIHDISMHGVTPLHAAANRGHVEACGTLCELGADPAYDANSVYENYLTPFQSSLVAGKEAVATYFILERGQRVLQRARDGRTMAALTKGFPGMYKRLREVQRAVDSAALIAAGASAAAELPEDAALRSRAPAPL